MIYGVETVYKSTAHHGRCCAGTFEKHFVYKNVLMIARINATKIEKPG
jgi:hypothetical protein